LIQRLAHLDCLHALATVSTGGYVRPQFGIDSQTCTTIRLIQSRHPVQEFLIQLERPFVPNDIVVGGDSSTLLVTGANMGGKSTILRQVCINVILAQIGCFVPATECFISHPIDRIFTRIGASDNILEGKSTFLTELEETAVILSEATRRSLVVIDELGRGTSTFDGVAIAGATLEHITNKIACNCLFATHYHKLCNEENLASLNRVELFHMECKSNGTEIQLTHKFKPGSYPHSQAIHVARIAGIPDSILAEAERVSAQFLTSIGG
jgi:DNA mismatch repair protein MSH6